MRHAQVVNVTTFVAKADGFDDLVTATKPLAAQASAAADCFGAQVCEVSGRPGALASVSRWASSQALENFVAAQRTTWDSALGGLLAEPPSTARYIALSDEA